MQALTTLVEHLAASIPELVGMKGSFPSANLPKLDQQGGHRRLGHLLGSLDGWDAFDYFGLAEYVPIRHLRVQRHQKLLTALADKELPELGLRGQPLVPERSRMEQNAKKQRVRAYNQRGTVNDFRECKSCSGNKPAELALWSWNPDNFLLSRDVVYCVAVGGATGRQKQCLPYNLVNPRNFLVPSGVSSIKGIGGPPRGSFWSDICRSLNWRLNRALRRCT